MAKRIFLNVPYSEKDEVKSLGASWDWKARRWWCKEEEAPLFSAWMPVQSVTYDDLSDEQRAVIDSAQVCENILVDACIGSGKTTTVQVLCNELSAEKILYLTFNRLLKLDAQAKIMSPNTFVTNYDGFAYKSLKDAGLPCDVEKNIRLFNEYKPETPEFDVLIMDEYQDIREDIAEMLMTLKERNPLMQIIAVGDMHQKIFNFTTLDIEGFMEEFLGDYVKLSFTKCFRLPADHAKKLGDLWDKNIVGVNENSQTIVKNDIKEIIEFLSDKEPKDILVLGSRAGDVATILNVLEDTMPEKFNKSTVYASIKEQDGDYVRDKSDVAIFTTFDSSKGLERKYCVVLDWTQEYWEIRKSQDDANYTILRNLFLVAASRGKSVNLFYDVPSSEFGKRNARNLLSNLYYGREEKDIPMPTRFDKETLKIPFNKPYSHDKGYSASAMFDFLYAEDIALCSSLIEKVEIPTEREEITVAMSDENIDLSMCIGTFVEAGFFKHYDMEKDKAMTLLSSPLQFMKPRKVRIEKEDGSLDYKEITWYDKKVTVEDKCLMLAGTATQQNRYCHQVEVPFISQEDKDKITSRLATLFSGREEVQTNLEIDFSTSSIPTAIEESNYHRIFGICDVVKGDFVYELKFTSELRETHFLQLAFYLCAYPDKRGIIWNVKTNEMFEVIVPDKKAFMKQVVEAISKRHYSASYFFGYEPNRTIMNFPQGQVPNDISRPIFM